jgi:hypothetical protein
MVVVVVVVVVVVMVMVVVVVVGMIGIMRVSMLAPVVVPMFRCLQTMCRCLRQEPFPLRQMLHHLFGLVATALWMRFRDDEKPTREQDEQNCDAPVGAHCRPREKFRACEGKRRVARVQVLF